MKYCEKCKKNFPDNQVFCSECGNRLSEAGSNLKIPNNNRNISNNNNANSTNKFFHNKNENTSNSVNIWQPVIFAAIGAVIGLLFSGLVGFIFGVAGVNMLRQQKKQGQSELLPSIITWILAVLDTIFWFIAMAA